MELVQRNQNSAIATPTAASSARRTAILHMQVLLMAISSHPPRSVKLQYCLVCQLASSSSLLATVLLQYPSLSVDTMSNSSNRIYLAPTATTQVRHQIDASTSSATCSLRHLLSPLQIPTCNSHSMRYYPGDKTFEVGHGKLRGSSEEPFHGRPGYQHGLVHNITRRKSTKSCLLPTLVAGTEARDNWRRGSGCKSVQRPFVAPPFSASFPSSFSLFNYPQRHQLSRKSIITYIYPPYFSEIICKQRIQLHNQQNMPRRKNPRSYNFSNIFGPFLPLFRSACDFFIEKQAQLPQGATRKEKIN